MKTVAHTDSYVHEIVTRSHLRPALASVVGTLIGGITATGSVVLSEALRPQVRTTEELHAAEQRASQTLKNAAELDVLPDRYLAMVAPVARSLRFRSLDGSDVSKPAGRAFEYLDVIRDGSAKPRDRVVVGAAGVQPSRPRPPSPPRERNARKRAPKDRTAHKTAPPSRPDPRPRTLARGAAHKERKTDRKASRTSRPPVASPQEHTVERVKIPSPPALKKLGYWMVQIEAGDGNGAHLPLHLDLYSTRDPAYQALGDQAWMRTYQEAMKRVLAYLGREGIWLVDRGFDSIEWMIWLHEVVDQNIIRLKKDRSVRLGTNEAKPQRVGDIAGGLEAKYRTQIRYVNKSTHEEESRTISYTWAPIWIDGVPHPLYLIVAHTGRKSPLLLVTDRRPDGPKEAGELIQAYLERWGNEEVTRACKQLTGLERIRVRSFQAIRRLAWLAMIALGIQALLILKHPRLKRATLDRAKEFIDEVRFVLYRIWRVVKEDMRDALKVHPQRFA